jgi:hypothetical protein
MPEKLGAQYWRNHAAEARTMADGMSDPEAKRVMLTVAASYDWMAERTERGPVPPLIRRP